MQNISRVQCSNETKSAEYQTVNVKITAMEYRRQLNQREQ
jgi:hypothetical protein